MSYVFKYRWWEIFLATLVLGVIFGFVWHVYVPENNMTSHKFVGEAQKNLSPMGFFVEGRYVLDNNVTPTEPEDLMFVEVYIDSNTKIIRTDLYLPTVEELKATNGRYEPDKLKRETTSISAEDFLKDHKDIQVMITTKSNLLNSRVIQAVDIQEINYISPVYPK